MHGLAHLKSIFYELREDAGALAPHRQVLKIFDRTVVTARQSPRLTGSAPI
jgi:hypothetical protein